jgi:hypothetical protein
VMLPVTLPVMLPIKPFVDVTGPVKVVDAMIFFLLHKFHLLVYATSARAV